MLFLWPFDYFTIDLGVLITPSLIAGFVAILVALMSVAIGKRLKIGKTDSNKWLLTFFYIVVFTSLVGVYKLQNLDEASLHGGILRSSNFRWFVMLLKFFLMANFYFLFLAYCRRKKFITACFNSILISSFVVSIFGLYQLVGSYLGWPALLHTLHPTTGEIVHTVARYMGIPRINSFSQEPKALAGFLTVAIIVGIYSGYSMDILWNKKLLKHVILILNLIVFLLTFARSAWITFLLSLPIVILLLGKVGGKIGRVKIIFTIVLCITLVPLIIRYLGEETSLLSIVFSRFESSKEIFDENYGPYLNISYALEILPSNFLMGIGLGNFTFYLIDAFPWRVDAIYSVHNMYLNVLLETGIFGLVMLLMFIFSSLRSAWRQIKITSDYFSKWSVVTSFCFAITFVINSFYAGGPSYEFFIIFGLLNGITQFSKSLRLFKIEPVSKS